LLLAVTTKADSAQSCHTIACYLLLCCCSRQSANLAADVPPTCASGVRCRAVCHC
jgi:hypothetical protein